MNTLRDLVIKVGDVTAAKILDQCIVCGPCEIPESTPRVICQNVENFKNLLLNPDDVINDANINRRLICRLFVLSEYAPMFSSIFTAKGIYMFDHTHGDLCVLNYESLNSETCTYIRIDMDRFQDVLYRWSISIKK